VTRISTLIFVLLALLLSYPASTIAAPVRIDDSYFGADSHGYGDKIGSPQFEIEWMDVAKVENLGFHWTMTCSNDVIEGAADPVPEPATMLMLGTGLVGLAGFGRKQKPKG
jgi:PEP-CTERM motif